MNSITLNFDKKCPVQQVWIIRYGLTEFPLIEGVGPYDSDIHPREGVEHANCIAKHLSSNEVSPSVVYSSPFLRCSRTAHILAKSLGTRVKIEEGLTEWLTPSLLVDELGNYTEPRSVLSLSEMFDTIDSSYISVNPIAVGNDNRVGSPRFIESEENLIQRAKVTLSKLLEDNKGRSFAIVSHAPIDQAMALFLENSVSPSHSKLGPLPLGGITMFSRNEGDLWKLELYGDTSHMPGIYKPGIKKWSLPCLTR